VFARTFEPKRKERKAEKLAFESELLIIYYYADYSVYEGKIGVGYTRSTPGKPEVKLS
jgi:hypothetical protein